MDYRMYILYALYYRWRRRLAYLEAATVEGRGSNNQVYFG